MIRTSHLLLFVTALLAMLGLFAASCTKQAAVHDPLGTVTLVPPYPASYPDAPTDKISVQYAVIAIADKAGIKYDWDKSFKLTDPVCREWIRPVIVNRPVAKALEMVLSPVNLTYTIRNGKIIIGYRR